ncbi:hypothetical protein DPMN_176981 [Dreissena polymorpha]|uniref:Uncharacterized protein n=1 Tax=Dreissena polymorpha TaxID=45954 RepID=A0A9D4E9C9_DREPO|nr:hypothetical protein DPMN_176981 [Dreissena polymorpha]
MAVNLFFLQCSFSSSSSTSWSVEPVVLADSVDQEAAVRVVANTVEAATMAMV